MEDQRPQPEKEASTSKQLKVLWDKDQQYRSDVSPEIEEKVKTDPEFKARLIAIQKEEDRDNRAKVAKMLEEKVITDKDDLHLAAMIFQHGENSADYATALQLAQDSINAGLEPSVSLIPQATDKLMAQQQIERGIPLDQVKQKFGTQWIRKDDGIKIIYPVDGTATEAEIKKYQPIKAE